jgi:putative ABC transport system permease protein
MIFDLDHWQEIWASLRKNKLRTLLTAFGVFWGIFMLVIMLGSGEGLSNGVNAGFSGTATNSFFVWARRTTVPYAGLPAGRWLRLDNGDFEALRDLVPEARTIAPRNQLGGYRGGNNVTRGPRSGAFSVMGDYPEILEIQSLRVLQGRFINPFDIADRRKVAVLGTRALELLFDEGENPIGDSIEVNGVYFTVVGVFGSGHSGEDAERDAQSIFVPFSTFQHAFNYGDRINWFAITSRDGIPASEVEEKVLSILGARHKVAPHDRRALGHYNLEDEYRRLQGLFRGISALVWIVGIGTLAAGVIGVSNIMMIIVKERTKEIGIRRAVGATPFDITAQTVMEAVILTGVAGYLGLFCGIVVVEAISVAVAGAGSSASMFQNPEVSLDVALRALGILVFSGALAGLMPAYRAMNVNPVIALHAE